MYQFSAKIYQLPPASFFPELQYFQVYNLLSMSSVSVHLYKNDQTERIGSPAQQIIQVSGKCIHFLYWFIFFFFWFTEDHGQDCIESVKDEKTLRKSLFTFHLFGGRGTPGNAQDYSDSAFRDSGDHARDGTRVGSVKSKSPTPCSIAPAHRKSHPWFLSWT